MRTEKLAVTGHRISAANRRWCWSVHASIGLTLLASQAVAQDIRIHQPINHGAGGAAVTPAAYGVYNDTLVFSAGDRLMRLDDPESEPVEIELPPELGNGTPLRATFQEFNGALFMHAVRNTFDDDGEPLFSSRHHLHRFDSLTSEPVWIDVPNIEGYGLSEYSDDTKEFAVYQDKLYFFSHRPRQATGDGIASRLSHGLFALDAPDSEPYQILWQDYEYHNERSQFIGPVDGPIDLKASEIGLTFSGEQTLSHAPSPGWFYRIQDPQRMNGLPNEVPYRDYSIIAQQYSWREYAIWNEDLLFVDVVEPIGRELMRYDGATGQVLGYDVNPDENINGGGSNPGNFVVAGYTVYFSATLHVDGGGQVSSLLKLDTRQRDPQIVIEAFDSDEHVKPLASLNSGLLFSGKGTSGNDLLYLPANGSEPIALELGARVAFTAGNFQPWQGGVAFTASDEAGDWWTYVINIEDETPDPLPELTLTSTMADEADGVAIVLAQLSRSANETVTAVAFSRASADAKPGGDYIGFSRKIRFVPGARSVEIRIPLINDSIAEPDEKFTVHVAEIENASAGEPAIGQVTIKNDDTLDPTELPLLRLEALTGTVSENSGQVTVTATLDRAYPQTVRALLFSRMTGSAVRGSDYYGFTKTLEFAAGELKQTVEITILDDTVMEPSESFSIQLAQPQYARLGDSARQEITIADDDSR